MYKLASGPDVKRYTLPISKKYILIPYNLSAPTSKLFTSAELEKNYPNIWDYLKLNEKMLRSRENSRMDRDNSWWAYNYPKNLDKQNLPRLLLASTVTELRVFVDENGNFVQDDRRVFAVLPKMTKMLFFLLGILNSALPNYIFKKLARPKADGYFDVDASYLSVLPIPNATPSEKQEVAEKAKNLQTLHTRRRDLMLMLDKRLTSPQCNDDKRSENWLWADVKTPAEIKKEAPKDLKGRELTAWAKIRRAELLNAHLEAVDGILCPGAKLTVTNEYGELNVLADGIPLIEGIFLNENEADFIAAQWRQKARQTNITPKYTAKKLVSLLLKLRKTENKAIVEQVITIDADIQSMDKEIDQAETDMNQLTYRLYQLTEEEIKLVEKE